LWSVLGEALFAHVSLFFNDFAPWHLQNGAPRWRICQY